VIEYLTTEAVADSVGLTLTNFNVLRSRWRDKGFPPPSVRIGRSIGWTPDDVEAVKAWLKENPRPV